MSPLVALAMASSAHAKAPPPPALDYDDSDTDSESDEDDDTVTNVQLGLADGALEGDDELNPLVSRIGGRVVSITFRLIPPVDRQAC
mgnify:CR=1 FL=1